MFNLQETYYYEGNPYRILHEGKVKSESILLKVYEIINGIPVDKEEFDTHRLPIEAKWIDVVIYKPLYKECEFKICVKEKTDFYNNYKPKIDDTSTSSS